MPIRPQALAAKPAVGTAKPGTANLGPVDELLAAKLRNCYQEESGHELPSEDAKLLDDAKASLVKELRLDEPDPSCKSNGADASKCPSRLSSMTCAELAEPIKRKGWDRHLLGADRKAIDTYMRALVKRKAGCLDKGKGGKDPVELDIEATRLGLAASMNLVTGRCQLDAKGREPCLARLDAVACPEIEGAVAHNDLIFFCKEFLRCRKGPRLE